jgi:thioredoxin reductase
VDIEIEAANENSLSPAGERVGERAGRSASADVSTFDVIIVGGGPAGLSAALLLGRCRRRVALCDDGHPRNASSHAVHGFLTRDGMEPKELLRIGREQLGPYGIHLINQRITTALPLPAKQDDQKFAFELTTHQGHLLRSRKLLIATGLVDDLPRVDGLPELHGKSVFHCPYCDAWEVKDQPLCAYGSGAEGAQLALSLKLWSADVVLVTDGVRRMPAKELAALERHRIPVRHEPISRLEGDNGILRRVVFSTGDFIERRAMFFQSTTGQRSDLALQLGCEFTKRGSIRTATGESTTVPGLYAAGDVTHDAQFVSIAAAEGTKAGVAINKALRMEDFH